MNWVGLDRVVIDWTTARVCRPGEIMTDMPFPLYAQGLYEVRSSRGFYSEDVA